MTIHLKTDPERKRRLQKRMAPIGSSVKIEGVPSGLPNARLNGRTVTVIRHDFPSYGVRVSPGDEVWILHIFVHKVRHPSPKLIG
jgi:ribosomal protein L21E